MRFSEMLVVLLVALLVIKPEHLPSAAYTLGRLIKRAQQFSAKIRQELTTLSFSKTPPDKLTQRTLDE